MSYFDADVLHKRIAELQQELLKKHLKVHEALRLRDLANERIAELEKENKELQECFDECYEELQLTRNDGDKRIAELEAVADNQIWPSMGNGFSADYVLGYEQATADISKRLKGGTE